MMFDDRFHPLESNEYEQDNNYNYNQFNNDVGRGYINKKVIIKINNGLRFKNQSTPVYASGFTGSNIRNAETGKFMPGIVGRMEDEKRYFKVKFLE
jgi:hypothetical protein